MELGARFVHLQPIPPGLFNPLPHIGFDRVPPVIGDHKPQHRQPFGHDHIVAARGLRIDRPLGIQRIALQRKLSRPLMLNRRLPRREHLRRVS